MYQLILQKKLENSRMMVIVVVISLSIFKKVFDTVDHTVVLKTLGHYRIREICNKWFAYYLNNRKYNCNV